MRISSLTIWLCAAFLAGANNVTFNTADLEGFNKTTVLLYDKKLVPGNSNDGYMFAWTLNQGWGGTVQSLILAEANGTAIVTVENDQSSNNSHVTRTNGLEVDWTSGSLTLLFDFIKNNMTFYKDSAVLYFQVELSNSPGGHKRDSGDSTYSYSPLWAVATNESEAQTLLQNNPALANSSKPYQNDGPTPAIPPSATGAPASPTMDPSSMTSSSSAPRRTTSSPSASKSKAGGLSTGAIAGLVVGGVVFLVLISLGAGCLCLRSRRRRQRGADGDHHHHRGRDVHTVQDLMADKEARAIMETAPDTPYSERDSHHVMQLSLQHHSSLSLSRLGDRELNLGDLASASNGGSGMGTAITTTGGDAIGEAPSNHRHQHHRHDDDSSDDNAELEHTSMMGSPVRRTSSQQQQQQQQDRSFTFYTNRPPTDYSQHHRVVDGADLVQQEQSNSKNSGNNKPASQTDNSGAPGGVGDVPTEQQQQQQRPLLSSTRDSGSNGNPNSDSNDSNHITNTSAITSSSSSSAHSSPKMRPAGFARARSTTPSGISGRYAHLVEDGMTDEEIRRLEEEERALDEAIEQSNTGRATPR